MSKSMLRHCWLVSSVCCVGFSQRRCGYVTLYSWLDQLCKSESCAKRLTQTRFNLKESSFDDGGFERPARQMLCQVQREKERERDLYLVQLVQQKGSLDHVATKEEHAMMKTTNCAKDMGVKRFCQGEAHAFPLTPSLQQKPYWKRVGTVDKI